MKQLACDLCGFCHQFGAIPDSLELFWNWKLFLQNGKLKSHK